VCSEILSAPVVCGQVDPLRLGLRLTADSPHVCELVQVRVYRGLPNSTRDPRGYAAARRQHAAWGRDDRVVLTTRDLQYPECWRSVSAHGWARAEVAAWSGEGMRNRHLSIKSRRLWCHWLDGEAYASVRDDNDYSASASPGSGHRD
jgi:hypothetical protein